MEFRGFSAGSVEAGAGDDGWYSSQESEEDRVGAEGRDGANGGGGGEPVAKLGPVVLDGETGGDAGVRKTYRRGVGGGGRTTIISHSVLREKILDRTTHWRPTSSWQISSSLLPSLASPPTQ
jgi:hypothetical protein